MINLPIFRAKKLDSNEYLEGWYSDTLFLCMGDFQGHFISYKKINVVGKEITLQESIDPKTLSIHFPNMLAKDSDRYNSSGEKDLRVFASLQLDGKGGDLVGYIDGHINYNVAEKYVISEDGVLFLRDIVPNIKKYTLDKEIASWYKIYGIQE